MRIGHRVRRAATCGAATLVASAGLLAVVPVAANASAPPGFELVRQSCTQVVTDVFTSGFACGDLWAKPDGSGGYIVEGGNEVFCQSEVSPVHIVACKSITETPVTGVPTETLGGSQQICGIAPHSACGALDNFHTAPFLEFNPGAVPGSPPASCPAWGESVRTTIALNDAGGDTGFIDVIATAQDNFPC
jgi:hypothetical protein